MDQMRRELLTWKDVDKLIDHLLPQFEGDFEAMMIITRGGIIPGGILAEAMDIKQSRHANRNRSFFITEFLDYSFRKFFFL